MAQADDRAHVGTSPPQPAEVGMAAD